jgi:Protein of unknown function (DUF2975)
MKRLALLKTLTTILFIVSVIALFFAVPFIAILALMPGQVPFKINGIPAGALGIETVVMLLAVAAGYAFFVYALYLFKNNLELFEKKKIFHNDVIKNFGQAGNAVIIGWLIIISAKFLYETLANNSFDIGLDTDMIITPAIGLFLLVLSDVFGMAKALKEENDLTV